MFSPLDQKPQISISINFNTRSTLKKKSNRTSRNLSQLSGIFKILNLFFLEKFKHKRDSSVRVTRNNLSNNGEVEYEAGK